MEVLLLCFVLFRIMLHSLKKRMMIVEKLHVVEHVVCPVCVCISTFHLVVIFCCKKTTISSEGCTTIQL